MSQLDNTAREKRALSFAAWGNLGWAALGIGFAIQTHSQAILLDGVFSFILLMMALLTVKIAGIVTRPDDERFPFGYAHFEPMINVVKALIMLTVCLFALVGAIDNLMKGGSQMIFGNAVIYGVIATVGCFLVSFAMQKTAKKTASTLVSVEAKSWFLDGVMSGAILLTFLCALFIENTRFDFLLPYLDPALVSCLVLASLPIPVRILIENGREFMQMSPDKATQDRIIKHFKEVIASYDFADTSVRILKNGREIYLFVHLCLRPDYQIGTVAELDRVREEIDTRMSALDQNLLMDISFIGDPKWAFMTTQGEGG